MKNQIWPLQHRTSNKPQRSYDI